MGHPYPLSTVRERELRTQQMPSPKCPRTRPRASEIVVSSPWNVSLLQAEGSMSLLFRQFENSATAACDTGQRIVGDDHR